ncbi:MAG: heme exporter protein CcmB [Polyangiales bacterium]|nr:heme exporter protein CcmB [Myxococcales bacterium]
MSFAANVQRIVRKEVQAELRSREITVTTGLFAALLTVLASLAFYLDTVSARTIAPGVLWLTITFAGLLAAGRSWAREREHDVMRALLLAPIPRGAIYLGKTLSVLSFLLVVEALLVPLVSILFHLSYDGVLGRFLVLLGTGTFAFVGASMLFAALSVRSSARELVLSILVFPLVAPALLVAVVATRELFGGASPAETWAWVRILVAFDLTFLVAGLVLFEPLVGE